MSSFQSSAVRCFANARVYSYSAENDRYTLHEGFVVEGERLASLDPNDAGAGVTRTDLGGATVLPAFADCHVHMTDTGYMLGARNFSAVRSYDEYAAAIAALPRERYVFGGNYDESTWVDGKTADAAPLERLFPDALAMV